MRDTRYAGHDTSSPWFDVDDVEPVSLYKMDGRTFAPGERVEIRTGLMRDRWIPGKVQDWTAHGVTWVVLDMDRDGWSRRFEADDVRAYR